MLTPLSSPLGDNHDPDTGNQNSVMFGSRLASTLTVSPVPEHIIGKAKYIGLRPPAIALVVAEKVIIGVALAEQVRPAKN